MKEQICSRTIVETYSIILCDECESPIGEWPTEVGEELPNHFHVTVRVVSDLRSKERESRARLCMSCGHGLLDRLSMEER